MLQQMYVKLVRQYVTVKIIGYVV